MISSWPSVMDLQSLKWSLAVADSGGFRKAAERLGVEQSAVSRRVRKLEDGLGVSLFHRGPQGVTLTVAGRDFVRTVEHALAVLSAAAKDAGLAGAGQRGRLRIGLSAAFVGDFLMTLLEGFRGAHPSVWIEMIEGDASDHVQALTDRRLDVAVLPDGMTVAGLDMSELWRDDLVVILPENHPSASQDLVALSSLEGEQLLTGEGDLGAGAMSRLRQTSVSAGFSISVMHAGAALLSAQVKLGLGLAVMGRSTAGLCLPPNGVVQRPLEAENDATVYSAAWSHGNDNPALRRFVSAARRLSVSARSGRSRA